VLPNQRDFLVRQEQYQDLLREAEQERLIHSAGLRLLNRWNLPRQMAIWLGTYVVKWGLKLQTNSATGPTCCGNCCLVELKATNLQ
jgi:hypothetical protein